VVAAAYGLASPACIPFVGRPITNSRTQCVVDIRGENLKCITGAKGDETRHQHDTLVDMIIAECNRVGGLVTKGGRYNTCKNLFINVINCDLLSASQQRILQGIIPDVIIDTRHLPQSDSKNPLLGVKNMFDIKTLASKEPAYTENGTGIFGKGALTRETQVQRSYQRMAKKLDHERNGTIGDEIGPCAK